MYMDEKLEKLLKDTLMVFAIGLLLTLCWIEGGIFMHDMINKADEICASYGRSDIKFGAGITELSYRIVPNNTIPSFYENMTGD